MTTSQRMQLISCVLMNCRENVRRWNVRCMQVLAQLGAPWKTEFWVFSAMLQPLLGKGIYKIYGRKRRGLTSRSKLLSPYAFNGR